ncbi:hypothetical protein J0S82_004458, partial [Galemys pyrenaicus]
IDLLYLPVKESEATNFFMGHPSKTSLKICGCTSVVGNISAAIFDFMSISYTIPDLWKETMFTKSP